MPIIPTTFAEWEHCITVRCGIPLAPDYITRRILALEDPANPYTQRFIDRWGREHHARTLGWFRQAAAR